MDKTNIAKIWQLSLTQLDEKLGRTVFETWIKPLVFDSPKSHKDGAVILEAPNQFFKDWVMRNYLSVIYDTLKQNLPKDQESIQISIGIKDEVSTPEIVSKKPKMSWFKKPKEDLSLNPRFKMSCDF